VGSAHATGDNREGGAVDRGSAAKKKWKNGRRRGEEKGHKYPNYICTGA
jgi:hypothetical protein